MTPKTRKDVASARIKNNKDIRAFNASPFGSSPTLYSEVSARAQKRVGGIATRSRKDDQADSTRKRKARRGNR